MLRFLSASIVAAAVATIASAQQYTLIDMGPMGGELLGPYGVNNDGLVVGAYAFPGSDDHFAFVWRAGEGMQFISASGSSANAINGAGEIAGDALATNGYEDAYYWSATGVPQDIGNFGNISAARSINAAGHVIGGSFVQPYGERSFIWSQSGGLQDLNSPAFFSTATGINDADQVVGVADGRAYLWTSSTGFTDLGTFGGDYSMAYAINNAGQVIGNADDVDWNHVPFLWTASDGLVNLGNLGGLNGNAEAINSNGMIVGESENANGDDRAFVWTSATGMQDLNSLVPGSGMVLTAAMGVNDNGVIVGRGLVGLETHGFVLVPASKAVSGNVGLQNYAAPLNGMTVTIEIRNPGSTSAIETHSVTLQAGGNFQFSTNVQPGTYDIAVKAQHWLRSTHSGQTITSSGASGLTYVLVNGDVNGDNAVTLGDFSQLRAAFGASPGSPNWNANADLNGDNAVTLGDFAILRSSFGTQGDP